jgi:hypothetical protein
MRQASRAISDCSTVYFFDNSYFTKVRDATLARGTDDLTLLYHELAHTEQCAERGGRDAYAVMWWEDLDTALIAGPDPGAIHDAQPMEAAADARELAVDAALPDGLVSPVSISSFGTAAVSPQPVNNTIVWTTQAAGGVGAIEFRYEVRNAAGTLVTTQAFSADNTLRWTPTDEGVYSVNVRARQASPRRSAVLQETGFMISGAGGTGGSPFTSACPAGMALAGLELRTGLLVDAVRAYCVDVLANGAWSRRRFVMVGQSPYYDGRGANAGGSGGSPVTLRCAEGEGVQALLGRSGTLIDQVAMRCGQLGAAPTQVGVVGTGGSHGPHGGSGGAPFTLACPAGQVATGVVGRSGTLIDQIDVTCGTLAP